MTALVTHHLPLVSGAPDGIKKLRELILELAVRGQLHTQSLNDEPATDLLRRIHVEKSQLLKAGLIGKAKPLPPVGEGEKLFALPAGWCWARFQDFALDVATGPFGSLIHRSDYVSNGIPLINPSHMVNGRIAADMKVSLSREMADQLSSYKLNPGDIVMARRGEVGRVALVTESEAGWLCGTGSFILRFSAEISRAYVRTLFACNSTRLYLAGAAVGTTMVNLNHGILLKLPIAVPPIPEQHRIVSKVDELMALCDRLEADQADAEAAHAQLVQALLDSLTQATDAADFRTSWQRLSEHFHTLFTTVASIDALKQAVLQLAVMGKLVPQDERADSTDALVNELRSHWSSAKRHRKNELLSQLISTERFPLPGSWRWLPFGFLADTRLGKMLDVRKNTGEFKPYLRNTNVQWRRFDLNDLKMLRLEPHELEEFRLIKGDLLVCEGGEPGRCAIWNDPSQEMYFQKALHRVRPLAGTLPEYLLICLETDCANGSLAKVFTGATIKHLTGEKLERYAIPVPSPAEQHRIVTIVNELMALCDQLKAHLAEARQHHAQLATALIEQAVT